ncbi:MAG: hypothetical protein PUD26_11170 [bacterium]|nr:hypothetical protein [bacterium]MDD6027134.1 hypothetical protein [bacterium]
MKIIVQKNLQEYAGRGQNGQQERENTINRGKMAEIGVIFCNFAKQINPSKL